MHATAPEFDEKEDVQRLQPSGLDGEEVTSNHLVFVVLEKGAPTAPVLASFGCWRDTLSLQYIADGRAADVMSELAPLALDLAVAPSWVLLRQPQDQRLEFGTRWRTAPQRSFVMMESDEKPIKPRSVSCSLPRRVRKLRLRLSRGFSTLHTWFFFAARHDPCNANPHDLFPCGTHLLDPPRPHRIEPTN